MVTVFLAALALNTPSLVRMYRRLHYLFYEVHLRHRRFWWTTFDFFRDPKAHFDRLRFYLKQLSAQLTGKPIRGYEGFTKSRVRDTEVKEVRLICNEIGVNVNSWVTNDDCTERIKSELQYMEAKRLGLYKRVVATNPLNRRRDEYDRSVPIQVSFKQFAGRSDVSRCVATLQIINHSGSRYPVRVPHASDDDSYLSLYTDEKYVPPRGIVRQKHRGHGYFVHYNKAKQDLIIKGPAIKAGRTYQVRSSLTPFPPKDGYSVHDTVTSVASEIHQRGVINKDVICRESGNLCVEVPEGCAPDLHETIEIFAPNSDRVIPVEPTNIKVQWDRVNRTMWVTSRHVTVHHDPYNVRWKAVQKGKRYEVEATADEDGIVLVHLPEDTVPDLDQFISLRAGKEQCIDVDPRDTDAHEFVVPDPPLNTAARAWARVADPCREFWRFVKGQPSMPYALEDSIPCTVIQCVDPIREIYRVEPNFLEAIKKINTRLEELEAVKADMGRPEQLAFSPLMSAQEQVLFWRKHGIEVTHKGRWFSPLVEPNHPNLRGKAALVREVEQHMRSEICSRVSIQCQALEKRRDDLQSWYRAYNDS
ncbi:MAG: hypothetical protein KVP17_004308, partial [Porospora cf. gigantea B]|uniref:uncharacterized protein n=1 Tax=Porospora cf. gigantea B TaxID=2853592 RepID=UPI003571F560